MLDKVTAFITRQAPHARQILLLRHPFAGIQFPAGTVEEGEALEAAVLREVGEETGLQHAIIREQLGEMIHAWPGRAFTRQPCTVYARPDGSSFDWARLPRGVGVDCLRLQQDFVQVTYEEGDTYPEPAYTTYQITGWVRAENLADKIRRRFFHLTTTEQTPPTWQHAADQHVFTLFWADLASMPALVGPQDAYWKAFQDRITQAAW